MKHRIHENMTRREMKQVITFIMPDTLKAFKLYCKANGTSMNQEIENYITSVSKDYIKPVLSPRRLSYSEQAKIVEQEMDTFGYNPFKMIKKSQQ